MATYVNDLRLKEIATGDESGTWGASTNTNLELIAEAFSFGTEAITTNADTHTTTIADGSTDPGRSIFLKYTGTLDSTCTITIGPNTVSKLWLIENATSGGFSIIIKQGSGATVTVPNGQTKAIYSDGAGSGAAMVDAFQDLSVPDLFVDDDLTIGDDLVFSSDSAVITFGADGDTTLTHTDGSGLTLNSTNKLMFNDASQFIQGSSATVLSLGATDEIDLTATAIDVNGTIDVSGNATLGGTLGVTGAVTADAGISIDNITIDGTEIDLSSGDLTIDVAGDIILDADGGDVKFSDAGTVFGSISTTDNTGIIIGSQDVGLRFRQQSAGAAVFPRQPDGSALDATLDLGISNSRFKDFYLSGGLPGTASGELVINDNSVDSDFRVESNGNTHMLFVDAGNDTVVIGSGSITAPSTVDFLSYASAAAGRSAFVHGSGDGGVVLSGTGSGSAASLIFGNDWGSDGSGFTEEYRLIMDGSDDSLQFKYNGNASTALTLSSAGAAIFGAGATFASNVTISTADNSTTLNLVSTDTDASAGPHLRLSRNVTGADDDALGQVEFAGRDDAGNDFLYAQIEAYIVDASNGTEDGYLEFFRGVQGTERVSAMILSPTSTIINENSGDIDFRVESNNNANMLVVDAGNDRVGIGATPINSALYVGKGSGFAGQLLVEGGSGSAYVGIGHGTDDAAIHFKTGALRFATTTDTDLTGFTELMRMGSSETVVNEQSNDYDFRVESNADANAFFVNGGDGVVSFGGMGTNTRSPSGVQPKFQANSLTRMDSSISLCCNSNDALASLLMFSKTRSGNLTGATAAQAGDAVGAITWNAADGTDIEHGIAAIDAVVETGIGTNDTPGAIRFYTNSGTTAASEKMRLNAAGDLQIATTDTTIFNNTSGGGINLMAANRLDVARAGDVVATFNRMSDDGQIIQFYQAGSQVGSIKCRSSGANLQVHTDESGIDFGGDGYLPMRGLNIVDNDLDIGSGSFRYDDIFATNGTIQTSDRNEKQDIEALSDAEQRVAVAAKSLLRKYRYKSAVEEKGDDARIHFGIIAQDLQDAFTTEGLDAARYAMFCSDTWWEAQIEVAATEATETSPAIEAHTRTDRFDTAEEAPEGAVQRTRLGVRYSELLAFIISAI